MGKEADSGCTTDTIPMFGVFFGHTCRGLHLLFEAHTTGGQVWAGCEVVLHKQAMNTARCCWVVLVVLRLSQ